MHKYFFIGSLIEQSVLGWSCGGGGSKLVAWRQEPIDPQLQVAELEKIAQHSPTRPDY